MDYNKRLSAILNKPANRICADCNSRNPRWASISLGVFVCIRCCGFHRGLGTHISKMKSSTLDRWSEEMFFTLETLDNDIANAHWEDRKPSHVEKPTEKTSDRLLEKYLRDKYDRKLWVKEGVPSDLVGSVLAGDSVKNQEVPRATHVKPQEANLLDDMEPKETTTVPSSQHWPSEQPKVPQFAQSFDASVQNTAHVPQFPSNPTQHFTNATQEFPNSTQKVSNLTQQHASSSQQFDTLPQQTTNPQHFSNSSFPPQQDTCSQRSYPPQSNYSQFQQPLESKEQEKNRKISQVMAMYQTMPQPTQPHQPFQALGAIAAHQFLSAKNPYVQQRNWPHY